jgi:hypothetical protein
MKPTEFEVRQVLSLIYVLNNMSHWRGEVATNVRRTLKEFVK